MLARYYLVFSEFAKPDLDLTMKLLTGLTLVVFLGPADRRIVPAGQGWRDTAMGSMMMAIYIKYFTNLSTTKITGSSL